MLESFHVLLVGAYERSKFKTTESSSRVSNPAGRLLKALSMVFDTCRVENCTRIAFFKLGFFWLPVKKLVIKTRTNTLSYHL